MKTLEVILELIFICVVFFCGFLVAIITMSTRSDALSRLAHACFKSGYHQGRLIEYMEERGSKPILHWDGCNE